jgi:hypothetical protein
MLSLPGISRYERSDFRDGGKPTGPGVASHLTREWHALAGCSPKAWIARELPFLQNYELGGGDNESDDLESLHQSFV